MTKKWVIASFLLFTSPCIAQANPQLDDRSVFGGSFEVENVTITSFDGLKLKARLYEPKISHFPGRRPAIIFTNSWTMDHYEYEVQSRLFADKGYIVLSHTTRGFRGSEGLVEVGGPKEMKDIQTILDWLEENTRVDVENIGMAGISYGGGIALLGAAHDTRVKTAVSMSAWGNLEQALYGNETIRDAWLKILLSTGDIFGRLDPELRDMMDHLREGSDETRLRAWAEMRSPIKYIDQYNSRAVPIFVANSYQDAIFPPAQMRGFYERLTGPKKFFMDQGFHASSAIPGIFGLPSAIWTEVHEWMDYWLKSATKAPTQGIVFHSDDGAEIYQEFPRISTQKIPLTPLNSLSDVDLRLKGIHIHSSKDSGATSGIPVLSDIVTIYLDKPPEKYISAIDKSHAAIFQTSKLDKDMKLRGAPRVSFFLGNQDRPQQLVAYLYEVNGWGKGKLVTHGVISFPKPKGELNAYTLDLGMIAYDLEKGNRLVLVIDTRDPLYANPAKQDYQLQLIQTASAYTALELPTAQ